MEEQAVRSRHQRATIILAVTVLVLVGLGVSVTAAAASKLNQYSFLYFPLGFYLAAQGLLVGIAALSFWFARAQGRLDREREESEEF